MGSPKVPDEVLQATIDAFHACEGNQAAAARKLGVPVNTLKARIVHARQAKLLTGDGKKPVDPVKARQLAAQEQADRERYVEAIKETAFRQFLKDTIKEVVQPMAKLPVAKAKKHKGATERAPLLVLTDWHFEERVKAEAVLGLNRYDIGVSQQRVTRVIRSFVDWKENYEAAGRFEMPTLTVALLGDMLTGTLHGLERHTDAPNIVRAALWCGDLIAMALADLAKAFPKVRVVGVVGNHGRLPDDRKVPTKDPTRSWDYMAYEIARRRLWDQKNIEWHLPEAYGVVFDVGGWHCYCAHGNFIPNNLGVVGYGVRRFTSSLAANMQAAGTPLRYAFFGHWHASNSAEFSGVEAHICPSLIGAQEYSFLSGGAINRPAQECHLFDRRMGWVGKERFYGDVPDGPKYEGAYEVTQ